VLLFFGYTHCPDICPTTMLESADVKRWLSAEEASRFRVVIITVDPARDTPETVDTYLRSFDPEFIGLVPSSEEEAHSVMRLYQADFLKGPADERDDYAVAHPAYTYGIDAAGYWRLLLPFGLPVQTVLDDVRAMLRESGPEN
jgi:protein SCO1/2